MDKVTGWSTFFERDTALLVALSKYTSHGLLGGLFRFLTWMGEGRVWTAVSAGLILMGWKKWYWIPEQGWFLRSMLAALGAMLCSRQIKKWVKRPRPVDRIAEFEARIRTPSCSSFPSSHAASSTAFACALCWIGHPWALGVSVWALGVSLSRVSLGVHYPSDVVGGVGIGVGVGSVFANLLGFWG